MITKYEGYCIICNKPTKTTHHLLFGKGIRELCDADGIVAPCCDNCHNMNGKSSIHGNSVSEALSKIAGQLAWEKKYIVNEIEWEKKYRSAGMNLPFDNIEDEAREAFRKRYGKSYL